MYIDSHAHLTSDKVYPEINAILQRAQAQKVSKIVNICTDAPTLEKGLELVKQHSWIFNAAATTPHDVEQEGESFFPIVKKQAQEKKLIAIGETGLDYHYEHSPKATQQKYLNLYFELAIQTNLPVIIHCRDAFSDLFSIADTAYKQRPLLLHCFTGTLDEAKQALDRGWMISLSGIITFKKSEALRDAAKYIPLNHILVETDTPYLSPQSKRSVPNEPSFLPETVALLASLKAIPLADAANATSKNAESFFKI